MSSAAAFAADTPNFSIGALLGPGFVNNNYGINFDLGLEAAYKVAPVVAVGIYTTYQSLGSPSLPPGVTAALPSLSLISLLAQGDYLLNDLGPGTGRIGIKTGLGFFSAPSGTTGGSTNLAVGPSVGYDFPLQSYLSIGGEANYLVYTTSGSSTNIFNLLAAVKFWF